MNAVSTSVAKILVVEDESLIADEIESALRELGYEVLGRATSADEAIREVADSRPDLVLMDIRLRGLRDGIQTAEELRDSYRVPVVFLSAHADEATLRRAKRSSPYGYVVKPFKMGALRSALEVALERHALETRVRESERWLSTTLRSIGDAVLCTDLAGAITFMNGRAEALTGWSFAEAAGQPVERVFRLRAGVNPGSVELPLQEAMRAREIKMLSEVELVDRGQHLRPVDISAAPILDDSKVLGAVQVFRDVSDKRAMQRRFEFADRLAALGTMAAGVAHEVNNPLAVIMANLALITQALDDGNRAPDQPAQVLEGMDVRMVRDILQDTSSAAERLRRIVADLRSFTQPPDEHHGPADVGRALRRALQSTAHEFRHRARVLLSVGPCPQVEGSELRLGQVFVNLLVNAAHAINPGRAFDNRVEVKAFADAAGWAAIEVRDSGAGIPAEIRPKIFDPFFTTKPPGVGTGLGLSVCHGIVKSLGGEISFDSEIGTGTVFRVRLPPSHRQPAAGTATPRALGAGGARASILVIDDEPLVRRAIERSLDKEHDVVSAATAGEALERLAHGDRFDLILCDLMMPEMTGMEMAERLRQDQPKQSERLVFLSGGAFTPEAAEFLRSAGTRFIEKPFLPDDLRRRVQELLAEVATAQPVA
jgi:PAS domain S-box-containing protein